MIYALRMQRERMEEAFVPSLREYAERYQIDARRLQPQQILMHPGPVNRGVELSAQVIDSPQALISQQVESGVVVRMAVLYELLASGEEEGVAASATTAAAARAREADGAVAERLQDGSEHPIEVAPGERLATPTGRHP